MSSAAAARVFNGCRALFAPAKTSSAAVATKPKPTTATKPRSKSPVKPRTSRSPTGILKVTPVSSALASFLGASESSRTEAVRKIWTYIKAHDLQNPQNKREVFCDAKLKSIFDGKDAVGFLEIGKLLSRHFVKTA